MILVELTAVPDAALPLAPLREHLRLGSGFEDEPGYWFGGRLRIETYSDVRRRWALRHQQAYPDGGIAPGRIDVAAGRIVAAVVQSRSTGKLNGRA